MSLPSGIQKRPVAPILLREAMALSNNPDKYISTQVLPAQSLGRTEKTGTIQLIDRAAMFSAATADLRRNPGSAFNKAPGYGINQVSYVTQQHGLQWSVDFEDDEGEASDAQYDARLTESSQALEFTLINRERRLTDVLNSAAFATTGVTVPWTNASADPMRDVQNAKAQVELAGESPNTIVMSYDAFRALQVNPLLRSGTVYQGGGAYVGDDMALQLLADFFGVPRGRVFVSRAVLNTANAGQAGTYAFIGGAAFAWIGYIETDRSAGRVGAGIYRAPRSALLRMENRPLQSTEWTDEATRSHCGHVFYEDALVVCYAALGHRLTGVA